MTRTDKQGSVMKRRATLAALAAACSLAAGIAAAQGYPTKPIRVVVPFPGGPSGVDQGLRVAQQKIAEILGQPLVIDNRGGANGFIGTELAAHAAPDGHTLLFVTASTIITGVFTAKKVPFDTVRDFTPVSGPRLLARDARARAALVDVLVATQKATDVSSTHVLFPPDDQAKQLADAGFLLRSGVQFHWMNAGYATFDDFLATLEQKKRKNIRAERRRVREAGVSLRRVRGPDITIDEWRFFTRCYRNTYAEHFSKPYLNLNFFRRIGKTMPDNLLLVIAERDGHPIAASLVVHDETTLYGRYWGALEHVPCLHFETAYYQPLEFCIEQGIQVFEGGAQGEHKMARGFLPTRTWSAHWLAHPSFADAVERFLEREAGGIDDYIDELNDRNPFRK